MQISRELVSLICKILAVECIQGHTSISEVRKLNTTNSFYSKGLIIIYYSFVWHFLMCKFYSGGNFPT